ncbi:hypothetical protein Maes01_01131 [Microbulbifer aestuariivivens]|uniref:Uncharacterized protein n=1 Tax=Microbulbifer aestuariivivens TaxID=1908308 RepID=A0ABP9WNH0_9GAMM
MKCLMIGLALALAGGGTMPVLGENGHAGDNAPGPMEYLQVEGSVDLDAARRERANHKRAMAERLRSAGRAEQISGMTQRQQRFLHQLLQRQARAQAQARAKAGQLRQQREAASHNTEQPLEERTGAI